MYLKSLTLKGFKSFASATTLQLEPGITCIVGPNGSGKSNVVDALAWVMGEASAKSLRGGKMDDVIFAGTSGRPPLGRAEVVLTIDNSDGALPIEYAEVTISRTMFRSGGSEYAINGSGCRLLDVQELLSDSGIGREMHVIVGQGQLDTILRATPEDRRGFVEEAAGVLKHRRRKEKALRKLDAMQANLARLTDLTAELRRQLKPLGRQAEVARRAAVIQADLRDARLRLLADDLVTAQAGLAADVADETALLQRREAVEVALADTQRDETDLEAQAQADAPAVTTAQETWFRLSALYERFAGTRSMAADRVRHLGDEPPATPRGRDPEELQRQAHTARDEEFALGRQVEAARTALTEATHVRAAAEQSAAAAEARMTAAVRAAADRREGLARLSGQAAAAASRLDARTHEVGRLSAQVDEAQTRADRALGEFQALETKITGLDEGEIGLDAEHERAVAELAEADDTVARLRREEATADRDRAGLAARVEALESGLARKDGGAVLLAAARSGPGDLDATDAPPDGVLGSLPQLIHVESGLETAVAAALGVRADAVAVTGPLQAAAALTWLRERDAGRATLLVAHDEPAADQPWPGLPGDARWLIDTVTAPADLRPALVRALRRTAVVSDIEAARALVAEHTDVVAVTTAGDLIGPGWATGGSDATPSLLEVQAAVDEAHQRLDAAQHRTERLRFELTAAQACQRQAADRVAATLSGLHESDARMAAVAEQLGQLSGSARSAAAEAERLLAALQSAQVARDADEQTSAGLALRLAQAQQMPADTEPDPTERDDRATAATGARKAEVDARLALRTAEERANALSGRAEALERAAAAEIAARRAAAERAVRRAREAAVAEAVVRGVDEVLILLAQSLELASQERASAEQQRTQGQARLTEVRAQVRDLGAELEQLTSSVHRDQLARAEQRLRLEALETRGVEEFGVDSETLVAEYGPDQLVPPSPPAPGDEVPEGTPLPAPTPYDRGVQEKRARTADKAMALLGRVNPLALEEYAALEERSTFLAAQLDDLKRSRADLLSIVREVDDRVQEVFGQAFADTAREFERVFARLFPGGEGRLLLTDPGDMLTTGIEVEARPPGKKVKRLSLLSGGERSLTAVAFLVALFRARPSPFYVLDEVEAALDDVNLGRLLEVIDELRTASQLIVITHQKRTMEIADALYGVSMRGDGVTQVIGQRLREREPATA